MQSTWFGNISNTVSNQKSPGNTVSESRRGSLSVTHKHTYKGRRTILWTAKFLCCHCRIVSPKSVLSYLSLKCTGMM